MKAVLDVSLEIYHSPLLRLKATPPASSEAPPHARSAGSSNHAHERLDGFLPLRLVGIAAIAATEYQ
jgi:hypothetical protein